MKPIALVVCMLPLMTCTAAGEGLVERFEGAFPPAGWVVEDLAGNGVTWDTNTHWGIDNWTGGLGSCACVRPEAAGELAFDTTLETPQFQCPLNAILFFRANYQNFMNRDFLEVDLWFEGGWTNILSWNEDHGTSNGLPGHDVVIPLDLYAGGTIALRFHFFDPSENGIAWYVEIDDVIVGDETPTERTHWGGIKALYR